MASAEYMARIPPGFRFAPTDYELIEDYLSNKARGQPLPCDEDIHDCEIYGDKEPWKLFGETTSETCYVFTKLRKKGKGRRIDRTAGSGTWKGQRTDPVMDSEKNHVGDRKLFVFQVEGGSKNKEKGHWIMHEFSLINDDQVDDWVLCRIYNKNNTNRALEHCNYDSEDEMQGTIPASASISSQHDQEYQLSREGSSFGTLLGTQGDTLFDATMGSDSINNGLISDQMEIYSDLSMVNPLKRTLPSLCCIEDETTWPWTSKRFRGNSNANEGGCLEIATLPSQLPPTLPLQQQQAMLGSMGDGSLGLAYQLPGPNSYYINSTSGFAIPASASIGSQDNTEYQLSREGSSYGTLLGTQGDTLFDAMMGSASINNGLISDQMGIYSDLSMVNPLKGTLPSLYCIEDEGHDHMVFDHMTKWNLV